MSTGESGSSAPAPAVPAKIRKRVLWLVFFTVFLDMIGFGIVLPLLPFYVQSMGGSAQTVGFLLTSFAGVQFFATPVLGRLSDRYGRRRIMLVSLAGNALAMVVFAVATRSHLLGLLFASRILAGATAGNLSACQAAIADVTGREERAKAMGLLGAGIGMGMMLGPSLGGEVSRFGAWVPPLVAAVMAIVDFGFALFLMPDTRNFRIDDSAPEASSQAGATTTMGVKDVLMDQKLGRTLALYFLTFLVLSNLQVALALLARERLGWGETEIGRIFTLFGVATFVIQGGLIGRLARILGEVNLVILGAMSTAAGMVFVSVAYQPVLLITGLLLFAFGSGVTNPSLSSLASRFAPPDQQGAVLGMAQSAGGLARTIGPTWAGFLFTQLGSGAPFVGGAVAATLSTLVGLTLRARLASEQAAVGQVVGRVAGSAPEP
jgi:MFS family permease